MGLANKSGAPYEMYSPIVAMDVAAAKATELPRLGKARIKLNVHESHTVLGRGNAQFFSIRTPRKEEEEENGPVRIGERQRPSTLLRNLEPGIAPSRLNAYIIRELDVIEKVLQHVEE
jgi:hypothetical protein